MAQCCRCGAETELHTLGQALCPGCNNELDDELTELASVPHVKEGVVAPTCPNCGATMEPVVDTTLRACPACKLLEWEEDGWTHSRFPMPATDEQDEAAPESD